MFEDIQKFYDQTLQAASAAAVPLESGSMRAAMGGEVGATLAGMAVGAAGGNATALQNLFTMGGINGSQLSESMAMVPLLGALSSLTQYSAIALSPVMQLLHVDPATALFSMATHAASAGATAAEEMMGHLTSAASGLATASAHCLDAASSSGSWAAGFQGQNKSKLVNLLSTIQAQAATMTSSLDSGRGVSSIDVDKLRALATQAKDMTSSPSANTSVAAAKAAMDSVALSVSAAVSAANNLGGISSGFAKMTDPSNMAPTATTGSHASEGSKMLKGISSEYSVIQARLLNASTPDALLSIIPEIVAKTELCTSALSGQFGSAALPPTSGLSSDVVSASAAHAAAAAAVSGAGHISGDELQTEWSKVQSTMQSALMNGDSSAVAGAIASLSSVASSLQGKASAVQGALSGFVSANPVSSPMMNQFVDLAKSCGMDKIVEAVSQGKIGTGLFTITESDTTNADAAIKEVRDLSKGLDENHKKMAIESVISRLKDARRRHVYSAISYEDARDQATARVQDMKSQQDRELEVLKQLYSSPGSK